jgi:hypothetical protein
MRQSFVAAAGLLVFTLATSAASAVEVESRSLLATRKRLADGNFRLIARRYLSP